jgi:hypothetical protein
MPSIASERAGRRCERLVWAASPNNEASALNSEAVALNSVRMSGCADRFGERLRPSGPTLNLRLF